MFQAFLGYVKVLEGVPGFLEGVPGCSGFSRRCSVAFRAFHTVPGVPGCSGVPCSGVPVFRQLLHAHNSILLQYHLEIISITFLKSEKYKV